MHLRAAGNRFHDAGQLAQSHHLAAGNVADVGHAGERQEVMLAHAVEADVAHKDHLIVFLGEEFLEMHARVVVQAGKEFGIHAGHAGRRFAQAFAVGIFADGSEDFAHGALDSQLVDGRVDRCAVFLGEFVGQAADVRRARSITDG